MIIVTEEAIKQIVFGLSCPKMVNNKYQWPVNKKNVIREKCSTAPAYVAEMNDQTKGNENKEH